MSAVVARFATLVVLVALAAGGPSPARAQKPLDKVALRLSWVASGEYAMYAYGLKRGLFAAEGIDLTVLEGNGSGPIVQSIGAGTDRFADVDMNTAAGFIARGLPVRVVAVLTPVTPASIIFPADKPLKGPRDLQGKKVALTAGDANHQLLAPLLKVSGVERSGVHEILFDPRSRQNALLLGQADAMAGYYTNDVPRLEAASGRKFGYFRYVDHGVNLVSRGLIMHARHLNDRDLNCRMMRATARAWTEAARDVEGAVRALLEMFPKAGSFELNQIQWRNTSQLMESPSTRGKPFGTIVKSDWDTLLEFQKTYAGIKVLAPGDYYTNDFVSCS
jgi:NitT/TauT family transport system substrate-binding protein